jgi:hypothetical protein
VRVATHVRVWLAVRASNGTNGEWGIEAAFAPRVVAIPACPLAMQCEWVYLQNCMRFTDYRFTE